MITTAVYLVTPMLMAQQLVDISAPLQFKGQYVTFGFEAEFRGENAKLVVDTNNDHKPHLDKFPFLDSKVDLENSGNLEVKSMGGEVKLSEVLQQMEQIKTTLKDDLKGFHLHIKIPREILEQHDPVQLKAWMNYLSDIVFTWRLENRNPFLSVNSNTLSRKSFMDLDSRGPVRLQEFYDGTWDFEIRGLMKDTNQIKKISQIFLTGLAKPELIRTDSFLTLTRTLKKKNLNEFINDYLLENQLPLLDPEAMLLVKKIEESTRYESILPLYNFESLPDLTENQSRLIREQNTQFIKNVIEITSRYKGQNIDNKALSRDFNLVLQNWSRTVQLNQILMGSAFHTGRQIKKDVLTYNMSRELTLEELKAKLQIQNSQQIELIKQYLKSDDSNLKKIAIESLTYVKGTTASQLLSDFYFTENQSEYVDAIITALKGKDNPTSIKIIEDILTKKQEFYVKEWTISLLGSFQSVQAYELALKMVKDPSRDIDASKLVNLINLHSNHEALKLIETELKSKSFISAGDSLEVLSKIKVKNSFSFIKPLLVHTDHYISGRAVKAAINQIGQKAFNEYMNAYPLKAKFEIEINDSQRREILNKKGSLNPDFQIKKKQPLSCSKLFS